MGSIIDGNIALYKDYEVIVEDPKNFVMRHRNDDSNQI